MRLEPRTVRFVPRKPLGICDVQVLGAVRQGEHLASSRSVPPRRRAEPRRALGIFAPRKALGIFAPRKALGIFAPRKALGIFDLRRDTSDNAQSIGK